MNKEEIQIYEPDNAIKDGHIQCLRGMYKNLKGSRWLIWQLFLRDIKSIYKQSFLGIFWTIVTPLIALITFIILNSSGIFSLGEINVPYPIFAILGLMFWQIFATGIIVATNSLVSAGAMLKKINFARESLVFASIAQALMSFIIQMIIVVLLFVYYSYKPTMFILLTPLMAAPIIMLTLGLGFIFSLINGVMRDLGNIVGSVMTFIMFITPVMYSTNRLGFLGMITKYNPLYYLVDVPRSLILTGDMIEPFGYLVSICFSFALFILCWRTFYLTETRVAERI